MSNADKISTALLNALWDARIKLTGPECDKVDEIGRRIEGERYRLQEQIATDTAEIHTLRGESAVLLGLLTDCASVLRTIDPDNSDEAERLADLLRHIDRAQSPSRHKGALL